MNYSTKIELDASAPSADPAILCEESGPLPFFGHCTEIHTSNAPMNLPEAGEADDHEEKLFRAPWNR